MFFRFLVIQSIFVFILYMPLLIYHLVEYMYDYKDICQASIPLPCIIYYSRFPEGIAFLYSLTMCLFMVIGCNLCLYEWVNFDLYKKERELYEDKKVKFAKMIFNSWDWTITKNYESRQLQSILANDVKLNIEEDKVKLIVKNRKKLEQSKLFVRRIFTFSINFFILCIGWTGIFFINFYSKQITDFFESYDILKYVAVFIPSQCLVIINGCIPVITKFITRLEKWDFQSTLIK